MHAITGELPRAQRVANNFNFEVKRRDTENAALLQVKALISVVVNLTS